MPKDKGKMKDLPITNMDWIVVALIFIASYLGHIAMYLGRISANIEEMKK
jgi:hypothetical protein